MYGNFLFTFARIYRHARITKITEVITRYSGSGCIFTLKQMAVSNYNREKDCTDLFSVSLLSVSLPPACHSWIFQFLNDILMWILSPESLLSYRIKSGNPSAWFFRGPVHSEQVHFNFSALFQIMNSYLRLPPLFTRGSLVEVTQPSVDIFVITCLSPFQRQLFFPVIASRQVHVDFLKKNMIEWWKKRN